MTNRDFIPTSDLKSDILRLIHWRGDGLSFVELCNFLPGARGDLNIELERNLWIWDGVSNELIVALNDLILTNQIHYQTCGKYTYMADGGFLNLPIADADKHYRSPHWLRVVIKLGKVRAAA